MVGCESGVTTRLKSVVPILIATHCSAHRLSLAACDASNASSMIQRFQRILNQIYVFFSRSSVRTAKLSEMQRVLNEVAAPNRNQVVITSKCSRCTPKMFKGCTTLQNEAAEGEATAHGLCNEIDKPTFVQQPYFFCLTPWEFLETFRANSNSHNSICLL